MMDFLKIGKLIGNLTGYIKVKIELLKLDIIEEVSKGIANIFSFLIVMILGLFVLGFGSLALAVFLNDYLDSSYVGYLIITGLFLLFFGITLWMAKTGKLKQIIEEKDKQQDEGNE
ncbi:MAG: phage holin family protein [Bacteroidetes bacterium]|nr:phage holin family protein [Bacteroidota bacterium]